MIIGYSTTIQSKQSRTWNELQQKWSIIFLVALLCSLDKKTHKPKGVYGKKNIRGQVRGTKVSL